MLQFALALLKNIILMATLENSLTLAMPDKENRQKKGGKSFAS